MFQHFSVNIKFIIFVLINKSLKMKVLYIHGYRPENSYEPSKKFEEMKPTIMSIYPDAILSELMWTKECSVNLHIRNSISDLAEHDEVLIIGHSTGCAIAEQIYEKLRHLTSVKLVLLNPLIDKQIDILPEHIRKSLQHVTYNDVSDSLIVISTDDEVIDHKLSYKMVKKNGFLTVSGYGHKLENIARNKTFIELFEKYLLKFS